MHTISQSWLSRFLYPFLFAGMFAGLFAGSAAAIDLESAIWYYNRNQWVPAFLDFQILAEEGDSTAMAYMGHMYRQGYGVQKNLSEAERWLQAGAEAGVPLASHRLGWMYAKGEIGGARDNINAVKHWKMAAEGGLPKAQSDLGVMYWRGEGVPKDLVVAYTWLTLASMSEEKSAAKDNLETIKDFLTADQIAEAEKLAKLLAAEIKNNKS
jgi:TPR repeat protein